jgi:ubiquinol-cytochrome c reductase cytochrome c1 subunit
MMKRLLAAAALLLAAASASAHAAGEAPAPPGQKWGFNGILGTFDRAALQRGFQVYNDVCAACHAVEHLAYRDLGPLGPGATGGPKGLGFTEEEVAAIAAQKQVNDLNDAGETVQRPARPSDKFVRPFPNERAARAANNGAYPVDLSLITKARVHGPDYLYALLTGYENPPAGFKLSEGMYYNKYFPGHQIAMPPPLNPGAVTFADNTEASAQQMARDVTVFLHWAAEPNLEARHQTGLKVMLFLIALSVLFFFVKRRTWAALH